MKLSLAIAGKLPAGVHKQTLEAAARYVGEETAGDNHLVETAIINLKLVDDAEIQALNKKYAGSDKSTDVLSFNYHEDGSVPLDGELGDVAISLDTAKRQAETAGTSLEAEVTLLVIHGCLHILGYDHAAAAERSKMDQLQGQIMQRLDLTYRNFQWDLSKA